MENCFSKNKMTALIPNEKLCRNIGTVWGVGVDDLGMRGACERRAAQAKNHTATSNFHLCTALPGLPHHCVSNSQYNARHIMDTSKYLLGN